ncbi:hypothetical protein L198_06270 [Cryptococcus wingfieldii CBS 7118]|uniref:Uncharacterized protein n=1 Tax=Cryptococcus wingfieldii CBS 7118 TaxID=1295528 RepID=A0A1E3INT8_9TREE|nr:hypothetical protein L198_06270 [Cryptococcus wingfieldii CBS 7118]ODN90252.1 hypothetical protein L198_06270 [Cryptococcus wingfieldii CBS 7118]
MRQSTRATRPRDVYEPEGPPPSTRWRTQPPSRRAAPVAAPRPHVDEATVVRQSTRATRPCDFCEPESPPPPVRPLLPWPSHRPVARPVPIPFASINGPQSSDSDFDDSDGDDGA